jgi:ABC-type glycerol-3-phosphate transport system substrate-binding protein
MSKFQLILLGVSGVLIVVAVMVFSVAGSKNKTVKASITIWGDFSSREFSTFMNTAGMSQDSGLKIRYVEKSSDSLDRDFTESLATGTGPDLVILTQDKLWKHRNKLLLVPYETINERDFKNTFVEQGELFLVAGGVYGIPFIMDPMVLYYNRDHLTRAGVAKPISYWDEMYTTALNLTEKDAAGNITRSAIALGESRNIPHSKEIVSMLMLQAGTPITQFIGSNIRSTLIATGGGSFSPSESALDFYTQFSNPAKPYHTWNRSLLPAQTHFTSGDSTYYLGFASELSELRAKNPKLNLGVASVPQSRVSPNTITYGNLRAISITRSTRNPGPALTAALKLASRDSVRALSEIVYLPPARRDLLAQRPSDNFMSLFYEVSLQSRAWLDPNDTSTDLVFREMIESVTSGRARIGEAVRKANKELDSLAR